MIRNRLRSYTSVFFLLAAVSSVTTVSSADTKPALPRDNRIARLETFFRAHHCPAPFLTNEYVAAADAYSIDYRLLPAVSVRESTCGLYARLNNRWGWNSAKSGFITLAHGIQHIARELAEGKYYRGKTVEDKLRMYNPNPAYPGEILRLMQEIDSTLEAD